MYLRVRVCMLMQIGGNGAGNEWYWISEFAEPFKRLFTIPYAHTHTKCANTNAINC